MKKKTKSFGLSDSESPAKKYFDKSIPLVTQRNKPFDADFTILPDGTMQFSIVFHGFVQE